MPMTVSLQVPTKTKQNKESISEDDGVVVVGARNSFVYKQVHTYLAMGFELQPRPLGMGTSSRVSGA